MLKKLWPLVRIGMIGLALIVIAVLLPLIIPSLHQYWLYFDIAAVVVFLVIKESIEELPDEIRGYRYGEEGEKEVLETLKETIDDNYIYIRNYTIPNTRIGDIDGLLIGPKGVIIIEVKNYAGVFRVSGQDLYRKLKGDVYKLYRRSPFKQVLQQRDYLAKFLKEKGIDTKIIAVVALVGGRISAINGDTKIFITESNKLTNHIFQLSPVANWSERLAGSITAALAPVKN